MAEIQHSLDTAANQVVSEFLQAPFAFFTEADAVTRFHQILLEDPAVNQKFCTNDGYETSLVHREYPTFFRFNDKNPTEILADDPGARRGHYDIVGLNPSFVEQYNGNTVTNRSIKLAGDPTTSPIYAAVEFKLLNIGWSKLKTEGTIAEMGKLLLSQEIPYRYLIVLIRYCSPSFQRWNTYWPIIESAVRDITHIKSVFAVHWLAARTGLDCFHFGPWTSHTVLGYQNG
jgi:hypothetical protein